MSNFIGQRNQITLDVDPGSTERRLVTDANPSSTRRVFAQREPASAGSVRTYGTRATEHSNEGRRPEVEAPENQNSGDQTVEEVASFNDLEITVYSAILQSNLFILFFSILGLIIYLAELPTITILAVPAMTALFLIIHTSRSIRRKQGNEDVGTRTHNILLLCEFLSSFFAIVTLQSVHLLKTQHCLVSSVRSQWQSWNSKTLVTK